MHYTTQIPYRRLTTKTCGVLWNYKLYCSGASTSRYERKIEELQSSKFIKCLLPDESILILSPSFSNLVLSFPI